MRASISSAFVTLKGSFDGYESVIVDTVTGILLIVTASSGVLIGSFSHSTWFKASYDSKLPSMSTS